jgi:hypothetical protein
VRLRLLGADGESALAELVTFLVRPDRQKLPVTVVLALPGRPALQADGTTAIAPDDVAHAQAVTSLLAQLPDFPFTIAPRPELLEALSRTNPVLTSRLGASLGSRAVLSMPYVRLDVPGMVAADLGDEVNRQWKAGEDAVAAALPGSRPDRRVWLVDGPVDAAALDALRTIGVQHLLLDATRLSPTPDTPVLHPVPVAGGTADAAHASTAGIELMALVTDEAIDRRLAPSRSVESNVVNLVAELSARAYGGEVGSGIVLMPSSTDQVVPEFWTAFGAALRDPGALDAMDLDAFLRMTSPARATSYAVRAEPSRDELPLARSLFVTRVALDQMASMLPSGSRRFTGLAERTKIAVSADLDDTARQAYFDQVTNQVNPVRSSVSVRVRDRVTLAGKAGIVPLSLLNDLDEAVSVRLRLVSPKIAVPDNDRLVTVPAHGELPVRVEVKARTSAWEFPVTVQLFTPAGAEPIGQTAQLQVRAVGLSGLGLAISAGALVVLASWWIGHTRSRHRAKRAAPASLSHP